MNGSHHRTKTLVIAHHISITQLYKLDADHRETNIAQYSENFVYLVITIIFFFFFQNQICILFLYSSLLDFENLW